MDITIKLTDQASKDFAAFYGFVDDGSVKIADFVTSKVLDKITDDLTEYSNRQAIASAIPVMDITSDGSQTALKETIASAAVEDTTNVAPIEPDLKTSSKQ